MTFEKRVAGIFNLKGDNWLRHANPWSVWTRFVTLPFLILAVWSRVRIGWYSVIPSGILVIWLVINPTLFKKTESINSWSSKAVIGEKYWSERNNYPVPEYHAIPVRILTVIQAAGGIILITGVWLLDVRLTAAGTITVYLSKMWFLCRMVRIYEEVTELDEMRDSDPQRNRTGGGTGNADSNTL